MSKLNRFLCEINRFNRGIVLRGRAYAYMHTILCIIKTAILSVGYCQIVSTAILSVGVFLAVPNFFEFFYR